MDAAFRPHPMGVSASLKPCLSIGRRAERWRGKQGRKVVARGEMVELQGIGSSRHATPLPTSERKPSLSCWISRKAALAATGL